MNKVIKHRLDVWEEEPLYWELISKIDQRLYKSTSPKALSKLLRSGFLK